jgi:hypothetical protein
MDEDRNVGVTEARFALTIVICVLVAVGYIVLARLGSSSEAPLEVRQEPTLAPRVTVEEDDQPQVIKIDGSDDSPKMAERSILRAPPNNTNGVVPAAGTFEYQR